MSWWKDSGKEDSPGPAVAPRANPVAPPQQPARLQNPGLQVHAPKDREPSASSPSTETAIAVGMVIEGKIQGSTDLRIAGTFKGDLQLQGTLTVDAGGRIVGNVTANSVVLGGEIQGNIDAVSRVAILGTGTLRGDLKAAQFLAEVGAQMTGRVEFGGGS